MCRFLTLILLLVAATASWADDRPSTRVGTFRDFPSFPSTVLRNVRPVMVYLPPSYRTEPERRYPVLYAHDAQNLFDERGSFIGQEWRLDETLQRLWTEKSLPEIIVVGVGHTGMTRMSEYMAGPSGDRYIRFLVTELKPFIDNRFRTKRGPEDTALMGSSMGGLIALWGIFTRPDVFGKAAALSPSVQFAGPIADRLDEGPRPPVRAYLDLGGAEGATLFEREGRTFIQVFQKTVEALRSAGYREGVDYVAAVIPGAAHNEAAWAARLDRPLRFLFGAEPATP